MRCKERGIQGGSQSSLLHRSPGECTVQCYTGAASDTALKTLLCCRYRGGTERGLSWRLLSLWLALHQTDNDPKYESQPNPTKENIISSQCNQSWVSWSVTSHQRLWDLPGEARPHKPGRFPQGQVHLNQQDWQLTPGPDQDLVTQRTCDDVRAGVADCAQETLSLLTSWMHNLTSFYSTPQRSWGMSQKGAPWQWLQLVWGGRAEAHSQHVQHPRTDLYP